MTRFTPSRRLVFVGGQTVSYVGSKVTLIALPWTILILTGSPAATGTVLLAQSLPYATGGFVIGPWLDRFSARAALVAADLVRAVLLGSLAVTAFAGQFNIAFYSAVGLLSGFGNLISSSAREAAIPLLAGDNQNQLVRLNAMIQLVRDGTTATGPLLGGLIITAFGPAYALSLDAATYLIAATATAASVPSTRVETTLEKQMGYWVQLKAGYSYLFCQPVIRLIAIQSALTNMLLTPLVSLVLLVMAREVWDSATELGFALALFGVGSILGALLLTVRPQAVPPFGASYGVILLLTVLPLWGIVTFQTGVIAVALMGTGFFNAALNAVGDTALQQAIPPELRGRTFAAIVSALSAMEPVGLAVTGALISVVSLQVVNVVILLPLTALATATIPLARRAAAVRLHESAT